MIANDSFTKYYKPLLDDVYDVVDRISINAKYTFGCTPGGFRLWWKDMYGTFDNLNDTFLMRLAGRYSRRVRGWAKKNGIPLVDCKKGVRKDRLIKEYLPKDSGYTGVFAIFATNIPSPVWRVLRFESGGFHIKRKKPIPFVRHFHFHIMDRTWGHVLIVMSCHPPYQATIILNGHEYTARQAVRNHITFEKEGNCFTSISDTTRFALVADSLRSSAAIGQLERVCNAWVYWCASFGVSFEEQERSRFRYDYFVYQMEYSRNLMFHSGRYMERVFDGVIDRTRNKLDIKRVLKIFGRKQRLQCSRNRKPKGRQQVVLEIPKYDMTVFKLHMGYLTLKIYTKGECVLRTEAVAKHVDGLHCGRRLEKFGAMIDALAHLLTNFLENLQCVDLPWVQPDQLDNLARPGLLGRTRVAGINLNDKRIRVAIHAILVLSMKPDGFTAHEHAEKVNELWPKRLVPYTPRQAAYDLRKLRGKAMVEKVTPRSRHYRASPDNLRCCSALLLLREKVLEPLLKYHGRAKNGNVPKATAKIDQYFRDIQHIMTKVFLELHIIDDTSRTKLFMIKRAS